MITELREIDSKILKVLKEHGKMLSADLIPLVGISQKALVQQLLSLYKRGYIDRELVSENLNVSLWFVLDEVRAPVKSVAKENKPLFDAEHEEWVKDVRNKKVKFNPWGKET
jgi:DNA-binding MarR family transcriptional regulator